MAAEVEPRHVAPKEPDPRGGQEASASPPTLERNGSPEAAAAKASCAAHDLDAPSATGHDEELATELIEAADKPADMRATGLPSGLVVALPSS